MQKKNLQKAFLCTVNDEEFMLINDARELSSQSANSRAQKSDSEVKRKTEMKEDFYAIPLYSGWWIPFLMQLYLLLLRSSSSLIIWNRISAFFLHQSPLSINMEAYLNSIDSSKRNMHPIFFFIFEISQHKNTSSLMVVLGNTKDNAHGIKYQFLIFT